MLNGSAQSGDNSLPWKAAWWRAIRSHALGGLLGAMCASGALLASDTVSAQTIAMVAGDLTDPFFGALKKGADDAAHDLGVTVNYIPANISGPDLAKALQAAVASKPAGLAYGDWFSAAEDPIVSAAVNTGIPVVVFNAAPDDWSKTGALALIGQGEFEAGLLGGTLLSKAGVTRGVCINHSPGASNIEQRCAGFAEAMKKVGGTSIVLNLPYQDTMNPGKVIQAIKGTLSSDATINGVFACRAQVGMDAVSAIEEQGATGKVKIGSFDLSTPMLKAVHDGKVVFTIDQQPYLQGYYSIALLAQNAKYGLHLVGQVKTGPQAIDASNVEKAMKVNEEHHGIRGAL